MSVSRTRFVSFATALVAIALLIPASALGASSPDLSISTPKKDSTFANSLSVKVKLNKKAGKVKLKLSIDGDVRSKPTMNGTSLTKSLSLTSFANGRRKLTVKANFTWHDKKYEKTESRHFTVANPVPPPPVPADAGPPTPPGGLVISAVGRTRVLLDWTASSDDKGVTQYDVYRDNGTNYLGSTSNTYFVVGALTCESAYNFNVVARDAVGNSSSTPPAGTVTVPCADATPPSDPTGLAASSVTETSVHLTWNPSNDNFGVDHYRVYYNSFVVGIPAGTAFDVTNMQCGEDADIEVTALDASGNESDADEISVEMDDCVDTSPPTAPTGLAVDQLKSFSLRLSWNPSSDNLGVTGYDVLVGGVRVRAGVGSPQTINLVCEQSYSLVVVSRDSSGNKAASSPLPVTMPECPGPSGVAMPTTNLPGWNLIFNDDFTVDAPTGSMGSESDPEKIIYVGAGNRKWVTYPETYKDTYQKRPYRSDEVLSVHDGMMDFHLRNVDGQPAGANPSPVITGDSQYQTYGRYSARLKIDNTDLSEYYMAWLLWPRDEALWENGESDYPEGSLYAGNFGVGGFAHYGPGQQEAFHAPSVNMHDWHTYTQEWTPTARRYYVDDVLIHTTSTPVYSGPERWQLQTETNGFGTHQGHLTLDWVAVYSYAP